MSWEEEMSKLEESHNQFKRDFLRKELAKEQEEKNIDNYKGKIDALEEQELLLIEVAQLTQSIAYEKNQDAKEILENVLNHALGQVELDANYTAHLVQPETKRAVQGLLIQLEEEGTGEVRTPLTSTGTMVAQLISILMSIIVIKFSGRRRLLVLDESLSGFSGLHSIPAFGDLLVALAENEGFQIIMVEHKEQLADVPGITEINVMKRGGKLVLNEDLGGYNEEGEEGGLEE